MSNLKKTRKISAEEKDSLQSIYPVLAGLLIVFAGLMVYATLFPSQIPVSELEGGGNFKGNGSAKISIVEFSDFQCPACYNAYSALKKISMNYSDEVKITFRHFPLMSIHPFSKTAAEASECAADQGMFWEMHDALFENQEDLSLESIQSIASSINLDKQQFNNCISSGLKSKKILDDYSYAISIGLNSTPSIFVDGVKYSNLSYEKLEALIESKK